MKAFVVELEKLFKLDTGKKSDLLNFDEGKHRILIPLYQREYIWPDEKIITLVNDVKRCSKYLGNVILDEKESWYEIVDGQQRITTCFLIFACLYNYYNGHQGEQKSLLGLMKPYNKQFILENKSIGEFMVEQDGQLDIDIEKEKDVYYQKEDFRRAFSTISKEIQKFKKYEDARDFRDKLMECEMLILIQDLHNRTRPVEQLFLDINEKAELLQPEDIFKGHCFENYEESAHDDLRAFWVDLKKCAMGFKKFGYKDASEYLYLYLLETDNTSISQNLILGGKHYLDGKTMDETERIIKEMITYGKAVLDFYSKLFRLDYRFVDLCSDSYEYRDTDDHIVLKQMCKAMLEFNTAQYQKLPFMYFIYVLRKNKEIVKTMSHDQFRKIITNLYIYMMLFIMGGAKKSKGSIDHTVREAMSEKDSINEVILAAKELRIQKVNEFSLGDNLKFDRLSFVCSVIDGYKANNNWIKQIYSHESGYTLEHFIIPDNRGGRISWQDGNKSFSFTLPPNIVKEHKKKTINYLVMDKNLNESLEHDDIVSKIDKIKSWYEVRGTGMPVHIFKIIGCIEAMPMYQRLRDGKGNGCTQEEIETLYTDFVQEYFEVENEGIKERLEKEFVHSFQNS